MEKEELDFENVVIISNQFVFDENGLAISRNEPVVHSLAKTGTFLMTTKAKDAIADRKEVLVIGDSLHDITMSEGAGFEKVVSVGIANDVSEDNVKKYESTFDMVLKDGESLKKAMQVFS